MRGSQALLPGQTFDATTLLAPSQAILAYRAAVTLAPLGTETVGLDAAFGRILARDAIADAAYPAHPRSTMDGFAVRAAAGTAARRIVGEVRMGAAAPRAIAADETLRIPTGGALPEGADAVVPIEDADERDGTMTPRESPQPAAFITPAADDMRAGDRILEAGRRIDGAALGVLATLGTIAVTVWRRPRIAIVSTGDELINVEAQLGPGQVRDSNRYALGGAVAGLGAEPLHLPRAADDPAVLEQAIRQGIEAADAVILTGGSSVGVRDLVPRVVQSLGPPGVVVHGLRVRPGKPTVLGAVGDTPVLGLPGNPASALMIFRTVAAPILRGLTGERLRPGARAVARAGETIEGRPGWTWFIPVRVDSDGVDRVATPLALRSSHTSLLARADGFVVIPEDRPRVEAGERVEVHAFDGGEV